jgi:nitrite reductase (NADH) small subunit
MPHWVSAAKVSDIPPGSSRELIVEGRIVAVYNVDGAFYALDGICPHAGGPLGEGVLEGCIVTCPWHGWQFDVTTGRHCLNARLQQKTFPVRQQGDDLQVELP